MVAKKMVIQSHDYDPFLICYAAEEGEDQFGGGDMGLGFFDNTLELAHKALDAPTIRASAAKSIIRGLLGKLKTVEIELRATDNEIADLNNQLKQSQTQCPDWEIQFTQEFRKDMKSSFVGLNKLTKNFLDFSHNVRTNGGVLEDDDSDDEGLIEGSTEDGDSTARGSQKTGSSASSSKANSPTTAPSSTPAASTHHHHHAGSHHAVVPSLPSTAVSSPAHGHHHGHGHKSALAGKGEKKGDKKDLTPRIVTPAHSPVNANLQNAPSQQNTETTPRSNNTPRTPKQTPRERRRELEREKQGLPGKEVVLDEEELHFSHPARTEQHKLELLKREAAVCRLTDQEARVSYKSSLEDIEKHEEVTNALEGELLYFSGQRDLQK
jgi:hypothetical protein